MNSNCIRILVDLTVLRVYVYMHRCQRGEHWSGNKSNHAWRREGDPHIPFSVITIDRFTHRKELSWGNHFHTCTHTDCLCLQRGTLIFSKVETCQFPSPWSHTHTHSHQVNDDMAPRRLESREAPWWGLDTTARFVTHLVRHVIFNFLHHAFNLVTIFLMF